MYVDGVLQTSGTTIDGYVLVEDVNTSIVIENTVEPSTHHFKVYYFRLTTYEIIPYEIGDNMIPSLNVSQTIRRVDRYEFALSDIDTWYDNLDENPSGFDTYVVGSGDSHIVKIVDENRWVYSRCDGQSSQAGIKKEDFNLHGKFVNITVKIRYTERVDIQGFGLIRIYAYDNTEVLQLKLDDEGNLEYFNGSEYILLYADEVKPFEDHEFYAFINYELDLAFLTHYIDGVFFNRSIFSLIASDKEGLKAVDVGLYTVTDDTDNFIQFVEYIGVYINGSSKANEFGYIAFDLETAEGFEGDWKFTEHNLFTISASGIFTIGVSAGKGYFEDYFYSTLINEKQYYNDEALFNLFFVEQETSYGQPFIIIYLEQDNSFENLTLLHIEGVKLTEGTNEYWLEFSFGNVDINESYFYVENNRLYFNLDTDDGDLEYIQASFDINNEFAENRSVSFKSKLLGDSRGFLRVNHTDATSTLLEIPSRATTSSVILAQDKVIGEFVIIITDLDLINTGATSGYIYNIKLIYFPDIGITITTLSLLDIIVPLMMLIVPTFALYKRFGEGAIIPTFILMTIICFITNMIPAWLFVVMMMGCGAFLFMQKKRGDF